MEKNISLANHVVLLLAICSFAGCQQPFLTAEPPRTISLTASGDTPLYIEYFYDNALLGRQVKNFTMSSNSPGWEEKGLTTKGSSFRLYAISKVPNGHVRAYVAVFVGNAGDTLLSEFKERDSVAVEITGIIP
jgi:hypothetical protein